MQQIRIPFHPSLRNNAELRSYYASRRVLVVGGDGFMGVNLLSVLRYLGADASRISRSGNGNAGEGRLFQGDLRDEEMVTAAVASQSVIFDMAGVAGAVDSNRNANLSLDEDLRAQLTLLTACAKLERPPQIVFPSSRLVYGRPQYLPVDESHPLAPQSIYAAHKIAVENYLSVFAQHSELSYTVIRLSNPYGPFQARGNRSYGVINHFLQAAACGDPIHIYGDGRQKRDYIHIEDVIAAFLLCPLREAARNRVFNLGGRAPISLAEVAEIISEAAGGTPIHYVPWPADDKAVETGDYASDLTRINESLELPAQIDLVPGLGETLRMYRQEANADAMEGLPAGSAVLRKVANL
jgi:nucleoside-diphosphate-sugar epimerase